MFHISLIILPFLLTTLIMTTTANPCPCELIVNESLSNSPPTSATDSSTNSVTDDEILEDYIDQLIATAQPETSSTNLQDLSALYPSLRPAKSLDTTRKRSKRPSWATVGKRATALHNKRPSWASVG